ncbi:hypothetical protein PR048_013083 [Dryococelus australis]|uniref:C2H2-type domain-containing protein n=1 Tax=Dryococelus australis TaxID=614101 RepID=A0ABQ9HRC2_9NEOP|nr:hypothetical protein PR048_013083 [Dryococelus australis]
MPLYIIRSASGPSNWHSLNSSNEKILFTLVPQKNHIFNDETLRQSLCTLVLPLYICPNWPFSNFTISTCIRNFLHQPCIFCIVIPKYLPRFKTWFDTSSYSLDIPQRFSHENKGVTGVMKDECAGHIVTHFVVYVPNFTHTLFRMNTAYESCSEVCQLLGPKADLLEHRGIRHDGKDKYTFPKKASVAIIHHVSEIQQ